MLRSFFVKFVAAKICYTTQEKSQRRKENVYNLNNESYGRSANVILMLLTDRL